MGVTISGMTGAGSIRHNNRSFSAANVDRSRTEQNIVFCNEDLKQVYHMVLMKLSQPTTQRKPKREIRYRTTMSISGRVNRKSCSMKRSSRSAT